MLEYSEKPVYIRNVEDTKSYQLSKQIFSYNCEICNSLVTRNLYHYLKSSEQNNQLLCRKCLVQAANKKRQKTCLEKYGADNIRKSKQYKEYCEQLHLKNYGVENVSQANEIKKKKEETCLKHFGVNNPNQSEELSLKRKQTCLKKYGVENPSQRLEERKRLSKRMTKRLHSGYKDYLKTIWQNSEKRKKLSQKVSNTWKQKTDEELKEIRRKARKLYIYDNEHFDSSWELAFWIWCKDNNKQIIREPICLKYTKNGKEKRYFPDFKVDNTLVEIKGNQLLKENSVIWKDQEKYNCAIKNNAKILYYEDCEKYIDYINQKYGKNYLNQFKKA